MMYVVKKKKLLEAKYIHTMTNYPKINNCSKKNGL